MVIGQVFLFKNKVLFLDFKTQMKQSSWPPASLERFVGAV